MVGAGDGGRCDARDFLGLIMCIYEMVYWDLVDFPYITLRCPVQGKTRGGAPSNEASSTIMGEIADVHDSPSSTARKQTKAST